MAGTTGRHLGRNNIELQMFGCYGSEVISDTDPHTPPDGYVYVAVQMLSDTNIDEISATATAPVENINAMEGVVLGAGQVIYGKFASIELTSGLVIAYYGID
jgi:hypothetical protein